MNIVAIELGEELLAALKAFRPRNGTVIAEQRRYHQDDGNDY